MKELNSYILEKFKIKKGIDSKYNVEFANNFFISDVVNILHKYKIEDNKYQISSDKETLCIQFNDKPVMNDSYIIDDIEKEIKNKKLTLSLYVTADLTLKKPEIYINKR